MLMYKTKWENDTKVFSHMKKMCIVALLFTNITTFFPKIKAFLKI